MFGWFLREGEVSLARFPSLRISGAECCALTIPVPGPVPGCLRMVDVLSGAALFATRDGFS